MTDTSVAEIATLVNTQNETRCNLGNGLGYDLSMGTAERLRERREAAGLSLGQVAEYEGRHKSQISKLETGYSEPPAWALIASLARRYRTSSDYLLGLTDDPSPAALRELPAFGADVLAILRLLPPVYQRQVLDHAEAVKQAFVDSVWYRLLDEIFVPVVGETRTREMAAEIRSLYEQGGDAAVLEWFEINHRLMLEQLKTEGRE
jgi:transcriptional regulator with XRE-family HTH domain